MTFTATPLRLPVHQPRSPREREALESAQALERLLLHHPLVAERPCQAVPLAPVGEERLADAERSAVVVRVAEYWIDVTVSAAVLPEVVAVFFLRAMVRSRPRPSRAETGNIIARYATGPGRESTNRAGTGEIDSAAGRIRGRANGKRYPLGALRAHGRSNARFATVESAGFAHGLPFPWSPRQAGEDRFVREALGSGRAGVRSRWSSPAGSREGGTGRSSRPVARCDDGRPPWPEPNRRHAMNEPPPTPRAGAEVRSPAQAAHRDTDLPRDSRGGLLLRGQDRL